jgi:hypothetical protein
VVDPIKIVALIKAKYGSDGANEALRRAELARRTIGMQASVPFVAAAIMLCERR